MQLSNLRLSDWLTSAPFFLVHIFAVIGFFLLGFSWAGILWCIGSYYFRGVFVTLGYHRYFAHRSFKTSRWFQTVLAFFGTMAFQRGVLSWAANHRDHHKFSDTEQDQHSPVTNSLPWSHFGWIISSPKNAVAKVGDLHKYPELRWISNYWLLGPICFMSFVWAVGGLTGLVWGGLISTVFLWHFTFMINSICHKFGSRRFITPDNSRNVWWLAVPSLGESYQNSHHYFQHSANQGMHWSELDIGYWIIKFWEKIGLVWSVKTYSPKSL